MRIALPTASQSSERSQTPSRGAGFFKLPAEFSPCVPFCMSGSVLAFALPAEELGGLVITDLQLMACMTWGQQHLQPAKLNTAEAGSVSPGGGMHSRAEHKVRSGMVDACRVSGKSWLAACAPGSCFCCLLEAWRGLQEQDRLVQMRLRAPLLSLLRRWREKPSRVWSCLTPYRRAKETSPHVRKCHGALPRCGAGACRKGWMQGSAGGDYSRLVQLCVASLEGAPNGCWLGPAGGLKSSPTRGAFMPICYELCSLQAGLGNEPPAWAAIVCGRVLDQQLPFRDLLWYRDGAGRW